MRSRTFGEMLPGTVQVWGFGGGKRRWNPDFNGAEPRRRSDPIIWWCGYSREGVKVSSGGVTGSRHRS